MTTHLANDVGVFHYEVGIADERPAGKVAACYLVDGARLALASLGVADYHTAGDASLGKDSLDSIVILLR